MQENRAGPLDTGSDLNVGDEDRFTVFIWATGFGHVAIALLLLNT